MPHAEKIGILIVEDEAIVARDLGRRLQRLGYEIAGYADTGADAVALAVANRPDIVLMDIVIQGPVDGVRTATEIMRRMDVPIIFLTAHSDESTVKRATQAAPYGYLIKPFEERELRATIETALFRHKSEARARVLVASMMSHPSGIVVTDAQRPDPVITMCNPAFARMAGSSASDLVGRTAWCLEGVNTDAAARSELRQAVADGGERRVTLLHQRQDGRPFWDEVLVTAVRDGAGNVTNFLFAHSDVTERRRSDEALLQSQRVEAIGRLTSGIAHDFNNILGIIKSFAGFVRDGLADGDTRRNDTLQVLAAAERGAALTRRLLRFSRQHPAARRPLDLNKDLAEIIGVLARTVGANIDIEFVPADRAAFVAMDPIQLDQVVMNLAINAVAAMPSGGRLRLRISHVDESGGYVRLVISDSGTGMDEATMQRIFEPFFTTKAPGEGTGLGLAMCMNIVADAGGTIRVASAPAAGSTFTIELPACVAPPAPQGATGVGQAPARVPGDGAPAPRRGRLLLVDDCEVMLGAVRRVLTGDGYEVTPVDTLAAAREAVGSDDFVAVICDLALADGSGADLVDWLREFYPDLAARTLILTGGALDDVGRRLLADGMTTVLLKPFEPAVLLGRIASLVQGEPARPRIQQNSPPGCVLLVNPDNGRRSAFTDALVIAGFSVQAVRSGGEALRALATGTFEAVALDVALSDMDPLTLLRAAHGGDRDLPVIVLSGAPPAEPGRATTYLALPVTSAQLVGEVQRVIEDGQFARLQRKLLASHAGVDEYLMDLPGTRRSFEAALGHLHMAFQPIVRGLDSSVFGYEALLRSDEPLLGTPLRVLTAAAALGRTPRVGEIVRRGVARVLAEHPERKEAMFVNIHPDELHSDIFCSSSEPLAQHASRVVLEITERATLSAGPHLEEEIRRLRKAGYRIALDDLGEGRSGLALLAQLKPDIAKIDISLVRDAPRSRIKREIISSMVGLCRRSGITVVAEGVESEESARLQADLGCELLQGYFYARPGPAFPDAHRPSGPSNG